MTFDVTILGSSSATPAYNRNPSAQIINHNEKLFLVDCGEATQHQLNRFRIKISKIDTIFISHLHGDHYLGLMGLLSSMHLNGRIKELNLYGPEPLRELIHTNLKYSYTELKYTLNFHPIDTEKSNLLFENKDLRVFSIPLEHRIPCAGFRFEEKPKKRKLIHEKLDEYNLDINYYSDIREGKDIVLENGTTIKNEDLSMAPIPPRSYCYCSDTIYTHNIIPYIQHSDLLYHEATFMDDLLLRAQETFHTTSKQAGEIAQLAKVKKLIIGHFSARYKDLDPLLEECKNQFQNSFLALEGEKFSV